MSEKRKSDRWATPKERHSLFRFGAFAAAAIVAHRSMFGYRPPNISTLTMLNRCAVFRVYLWLSGLASKFSRCVVRLQHRPLVKETARGDADVADFNNELVADIHDRMPLILAPGDYARWLGEEPDPRDLMRPFPAEPMHMWPISTRVNKPVNDDPSIVEPVEAATDAA